MLFANHRRALVYVSSTLVTAVFLYLFYAAWMGWVLLNTVTLILTIANSLCLVFWWWKHG